ncbi:MAG: prepilin-type N-terminal cleavage/methylation domain-containing protein [Cyanobacteria bacterium P01_D01_bin.116]
MRRGSGFSLLELVVVVGVVAVVSAVAAARFDSMGARARHVATLEEFRRFERAFLQYQAAEGSFPPDVHHGLFPPEMAGYLSRESWLAPSPMGGWWDWNNAEHPWWAGRPSNIAVWSDPFPADRWLLFDEWADDGNGGTGRFLRYGNAYYTSVE